MINPITNNPTSILSENMNTITVAIPPKIKDKMKRVKDDDPFELTMKLYKTHKEKIEDVKEKDY